MIALLVDELGAALSPDRVRVGDTELALYKRDASNLEGHAGVVCFPTTTAEVQSCVQIAIAHGRPFVARGFDQASQTTTDRRPAAVQGRESKDAVHA